MEDWGRDGLFHVHVPLCARHLRLLKATEVPGIHLHCDRPLRRACVVGCVVDVIVTRKFTRFAVDDGTGCALCLVWTSSCDLTDQAHEAAGAALCVPSLGDLVRVRGKVSSHGGQMQVVVTACEVLTDTNVEILHWLDAVSAQTRLEATGQLLAPG